MYWKFDPDRFALQQLPPCLRKKGIYAIIKCLMIGISRVHALFVSHKETVDQKLSHDGTTMSLESFLNEKFGSGIYLKEYRTENAYMHFYEEIAENVYMGYQEENEALWVPSKSPDTITGGFAVMVPTALATDENIAAIKRWVEYYRAAGTIYKIEIYE